MCQESVWQAVAAALQQSCCAGRQAALDE